MAIKVIKNMRGEKKNWRKVKKSTKRKLKKMHFLNTGKIEKIWKKCNCFKQTKIKLRKNYFHENSREREREIFPNVLLLECEQKMFQTTDESPLVCWR